MTYELENILHNDCDTGNCNQCNKEIFTELSSNNDADLLFDQYGLEL